MIVTSSPFTANLKSSNYSQVISNQTNLALDQKLEDQLFFSYSRLISGSGEDSVDSITFDLLGNIIVAGYTTSTDLIMKDSQFPAHSGDIDVYIMKFNNADELVWSTYLGGTNTEYPASLLDDFPKNTALEIKTDSFDNVIVAGYTSSEDFPFDTSPENNLNLESRGFITKFSSNGSLIWNRPLTTDRNELILDFDINGENDIILTGKTWIAGASLSYQATDAFVIKINSQGEDVWPEIKILDGGDLDYGAALKVDPLGNIIVTGATRSPEFPQVGFSNEYEGGRMDIFLIKMDSDTGILWSRLFGGGGEDQVIDLDIDTNGQILLTGMTTSDFTKSVSFSRAHGFVAIFSTDGMFVWSLDPIWENADFESAVFDMDNNIIVAGETQVKSTTRMILSNSYLRPESGNIERSMHITKIAIFGTEIWSTLISQSSDRTPAGKSPWDDEIFEIILTDEGKITIIGETWVDGSNPPQIPSTLENDDDPQLKSGYIAQIYDPIEDEDGDFLTNQYEFVNGLNITDQTDAFLDQDEDRLSTLQESFIGTDPWLADTDQDMIPDGWEFENGFNPLDASDANEDIDGDLLSNLGEYQLGLDPKNATDGLLDYDADGLPTYWEFQYGFEPFTTSDAANDADNDGLTALEEYKAGTNPTKPDTDGDGELDGFEIDNGSNPLDPNSNYTTIQRNRVIAIVIIIAFILGPILGYRYFRSSRKKRLEDAQKFGYDSYAEYNEAMKMGFTDANQQNARMKAGFINNEVYFIAKQFGYDSDRSLVEALNIYNKTFNVFSGSLESKIVEKLEPLNLTKTITSFQPVKVGINFLLEEISDIQEKANELSQFLSKIEIIIKNVGSRILVSVANSELHEFSNSFKDFNSKIKIEILEISTKLRAKEQYFEPWSRLVDFLKIIEEGTPVTISYIATTLACSQDQVRDFISGILIENPLLGQLDPVDDTFNRQVNTLEQIDAYITEVKNLLDTDMSENV